jgi:hypothetical protein
MTDPQPKFFERALFNNAIGPLSTRALDSADHSTFRLEAITS